jgi:hypothetical protein
LEEEKAEMMVVEEEKEKNKVEKEEKVMIIIYQYLEVEKVEMTVVKMKMKEEEEEKQEETVGVAELGETLTLYQELGEEGDQCQILGEGEEELGEGDRDQCQVLLVGEGEEEMGDDQEEEQVLSQMTKFLKGPLLPLTKPLMKGLLDWMLKCWPGLLK